VCTGTLRVLSTNILIVVIKFYIMNCVIQDCNRVAHANGFCKTHDRRVKLNGIESVDIGRKLKDNVVKPKTGSYSAMISRCYNKNHNSYKNYGAKGIIVCDRWLGYSGHDNFIEDMGDRPSVNHSLDIIDNNGNYEPNNCRWATKLEQQAKRSNSNKNVGVYELKPIKGRKSKLPFKASLFVNGKRYEKLCSTIEEAIKQRRIFESMYT
jgi:hypothetical protein